MTTNQTERVSDEELDQMILKLERDGMTPKQLSLMRELREVRRAKAIYQVMYGECWRDVTEEQYHDHAIHESPIRILYTAPPASAYDANSHADAGMITEGHQQLEREEQPMCRNCNDGIRNGCSSCVYKDK